MKIIKIYWLLFQIFSDIYKTKKTSPYIIAVGVPQDQTQVMEELKGKSINLFVHQKSNLIESLTNIQKALIKGF